MTSSCLTGDDGDRRRLAMANHALSASLRQDDEALANSARAPSHTSRTISAAGLAWAMAADWPAPTLHALRVTGFLSGGT